MHEEYKALCANQIWNLTTLPPDIQPIGCKWVFKNKYNPNGTLHKHKLRLVAKGFHQLEDLDYSETFSLVVKLTTIRIICTLTLSYNWHINQIDINNAFLYGDLQEDVFILQPPGFEYANSNLVCKLHKAIYGFKQAPQSWF